MHTAEMVKVVWIDCANFYTDNVGCAYINSFVC